MDLLLIPFIVCIALVGIHVYFGQTVIQRGIIFIDLALAQWAALGYLVGHYFYRDRNFIFVTFLSKLG